MRRPLILVVNPGSTSTKLALFRGPARFEEWTRSHLEEIEEVGVPLEQIAASRTAGVLDDLRWHGLGPEALDVVAARGGLLRPLPGGVYRVNRKMLEELASCAHGRHLSNLGALIAWRLTGGRPGRSFIVNPVVVDELWPVARLSGHPEIPRRSVFHALNQKAVAVRVAARLGKTYDSARLIVVHAGGGVSVGAHLKGRVVDVNNALEGEGAFSPERTGGLPLLEFLRLVSARGLGFPEAQHLVTRAGGLSAYLGTKDCLEVEKRVREGDRQARIAYQAFVYQVAKDAGALAAAVFRGRVDAVALTGGIAAGPLFRRWLKAYLRFLGPVFVYPGTLEMEALAAGAWEVWSGKARATVYR
jgi:butyrate kinase